MFLLDSYYSLGVPRLGFPVKSLYDMARPSKPLTANMPRNICAGCYEEYRLTAGAFDIRGKLKRSGSLHIDT